MADIYVRSTDGSDADNGSTWALAKASLTGAAAIDAAGDRIFLSQVHAESTASALTIALAGTAAAPTKIICADDSAAPPTASAATASITTTGASAITFTGAAFYAQGLTISCASGASGASITLNQNGSSRVCWQNSYFIIGGTGAGGVIVAAGTAGTTEIENCDFRFAAVGQGLRTTQPCFVKVNGGSLVVSGGVSPNNFIYSVAAGSQFYFSGFDLSAASSGINLCVGNSVTRSVWRDCRLPASWSGSLVSGTISPGERHEMHNCDSADTNYRLLVVDYAGSIASETTVIRTGGASDGATSFSWAMTSSANAEFPYLYLASPEIARWNATVGAPVTVTVEIITDGVTLSDDECWLEVLYLGTSGAPLGEFATDRKADVLATAAAQTSSSESWTTTGLGSPTKQKLSVTLTPQEVGYLQAVVKLARASTTVYACPKMTVT